MKVCTLLLFLACSLSAENQISTQFLVKEVTINKFDKRVTSVVSAPKIIQREGEQAVLTIGAMELKVTPHNTPKGMQLKGFYSFGKTKAPFNIILKKGNDTLVIHKDDKSFYELKITSKPLPPGK